LRQFLAFAAVGTAATAIQYCILVAGVEWVGWAPPLSSGVGFTVSSVLNYLLNRLLTFRSSRPHASAASCFAAVALGGLLLNAACMGLLVEHWHIQYVLAQVVATLTTLIWTFCGNAFWSFANPSGQACAVNGKEA
jgi:putative flippase GtrA